MSMRILVSNDDGYHAPGIGALADAMRQFGEVVVVAPNKDCSGASNSLTLDRPLVVHQHGHEVFSVNGTPTDCVHLAVTGLLDHAPDLVVSGINNGANMGEDTIYSGTVAAAMEGYLMGLPAIAVSLASKRGENYMTAARAACGVVEQLIALNDLPHCLLNINVPDIPLEQVRQTRLTRLGKRHKAEGVVKSENPRGQTVYWVGAAGNAKDDSEGTDFFAVNNNAVSVTPLQTDLTCPDRPAYLTFD